MVDTRLTGLIAAVNETAPILEMMPQHKRAAFLARLLKRRIPGHIVALRIVLAAIEQPPALRAPLHDTAAAFRAFGSGILQQRLRIPALRESRAGQELPIAPLLHDHHAAAELALHIRYLDRQLDMADCLIRLRERLLEWPIEIPQQLVLFDLAISDFIELILKAGREFHIDDILEILLQHIDDDKAQLGRLEMLIRPDHIAAGQDGLDDRRVGARTADFLFLQRLDERSLIVARRRFRKVLLRQYLAEVEAVPGRQLRQQHVPFLLVLRTGIHRHKARELEL